MDSPNEQQERTSSSMATRERLMAAAAELIAELGWGRVTTRAVAARADLPHGTVSYHFHGKQNLLVESVLHAFAQAVPPGQREAPVSVSGLIGYISTQITAGAGDSVLTRLMLEAMREAERDPELRSRLGEMLEESRNGMIAVIRADQERGVLPQKPSAETLATLLASVGDGLLLHSLIDARLDPSAAIDAFAELLGVSQPVTGTSAARRRHR
jgi:AcrR family transcriptional regulator